jgi:hypothetical protein
MKLSVESYLISALVDEGSPKLALQAGVTSEDFEIYDEEWNWIVARADKRKPISPRLFKQRFPEFDFLMPQEKISDLLNELKQERAFVAVSSAVDEIFTGDDPLSPENAIDKAFQLRDILGDVLKLHSPNTDVAIKSDWRTSYERMKSLFAVRLSGQKVGIPTGIAHFDAHFGGLQKETSYLFLGRPGDAKSFTMAKLITEAAWHGYRVGMFSPEMTRHQHECRFWTLLSAKEKVQQECNLTGAFKNRSLKDHYGYNVKKFKAFLEWLDMNLKGEIHLFTQFYRREKMSLGYIESRIEDLNLDMICIDPIYKLRPPRRRGTKWEELSEITDALVDLSHTYDIPVVMSNQANRALVGKREIAPGKDSSFGSDAPVQEANCVIGVKHFSEERMMQYHCTKNRDGEEFRCKCRFRPNDGILEDVTPLRGSENGYDPDKANALMQIMEES